MSDILETARRVLSLEAEGITGLIQRLDHNFEEAVEMIFSASGKVVTTGIGKSGIVARKIMATMNSTGTPAVYLHPVEALHGDLGQVSAGDVVLALSNSGQTEELVHLIPQLRSHGAKVIAMTGGLESLLARASDLVLDCGVAREACPLGLAPTTSTTAALALGDALAVVLIEKRQFKAEDFRRHHPGGKLGERLSQSVAQIMLPLEKIPVVAPGASALEAARAIDAGGLGTVLIRGDNGLAGIFTDGDLRRAMLAGVDLQQTPVGRVMTANPTTVAPFDTAADALGIMEKLEITALPIVENGQIRGMVHLHDLLGRGAVSFKQAAC